MKPIEKVAVIGAGVMGAGIAAQVANAGVQVLLLDIVPKDADDRSTIAKTALQKLKKSNPAAFMHPRNVKLVTPGNIEDDLNSLSDCDWVVEAVIERADIKQDLYKNVFKHVPKHAVVSSNTSTLPLSVLTAKMTAAHKKRFMITHFFNPPRYLRLLELVTADETDEKAVSAVREFADVRLGKMVLNAKDTPGFIANRIGTYWMQAAVRGAMDNAIDVETADQLLGRPAGVPKTGVFGLLDLVGLDLMPHVLGSLSEALPEDDSFHAFGGTPKLLENMIAEGYTGRKGKGGFYRLNKQGGKKVKEVVSLKDGSYAPAKRSKPPALKAAKKNGLRGLVSHDSAEGRYAWQVLSATYAYAASLVPEIADDIYTVDQAMRLGFNWKYGPFELIDKMGVGWFVKQLEAEGRTVPEILAKADGRSLYTVQNGALHFMGLDGQYHQVERPQGVLLLEDVKRGSKPLLANKSASLWDIGDEVACLEFHSKMNSLNPFSLWLTQKSVNYIKANSYKGLVVYNEGSNFSVGANIGMLLVTSKLRAWPLIRLILKKGQDVFNQLKFAPFPVVGAPSGMALGGGCEVLLHCDRVQAHAETYIGLVEAGVGIVPGWGGCKEMLGRAFAEKGRAGGPMSPIMKVFETIALAKVAKSAYEAKDLLFLREGDDITMNRNRVLAEAKVKVLTMSENYVPPEPYAFQLPGRSALAALTMGVDDFVKKGVATPHDATIAKQLSRVLSGGETDITDTLDETDILRLECDAIVTLAKTPKTRARIVHLLKTGKPLRN